MSPDKHLKILSQMESDKQVHEPTWREILDYTFPIRNTLTQAVVDANTAQSKQAEMLDSTLTDAATILVATIQDSITPANTVWADMDAEGEGEGDRWLGAKANEIHKNIHAANFDSESYGCIQDAVTVGWFCLYTDMDQDGYHFEQWPMHTVFFKSSKYRGRVDTVYRKYKLTAEQALAEYGQLLSEKARQLAVDAPSTKLDFVQAIYPNPKGDPNALKSTNLPFLSCVIEVAGKNYVRESGYHEFPCVVPRMNLIPDSCYAVGKAFDCLPEAKRLRSIARAEMDSADIAVHGMWIAEDDGVLNPRAIKIGAKKVIVANSVDSMKSLTTGANFQVADSLIARLQASIRKAMMADQIPPMEGAPRTATEFHMRLALIRKLLGPMAGRLQSEYVQPLMERCFGLAMRSGQLGEPPEELRGKAFSIRYLSPLARAAKMEDVNAINQAYQTAAQIYAVKQDPSVFDHLDDDKAMTSIMDAIGTPTSVTRSEEEMKKVREQRAEQAKQQQAQQMAMQAAQMAAQPQQGAPAAA